MLGCSNRDSKQVFLQGSAKANMSKAKRDLARQLIKSVGIEVVTSLATGFLE